MAPQLSNIHIPQIRVSDFEVLSDWDFDGVGKTFGDKVPGYRSTSSESHNHRALRKIAYL